MCLKQTFYEASDSCATELFHSQTTWPAGNVETDPLGQSTYRPECVAGQQGAILDLDENNALTGKQDPTTGNPVTHPVLSTAAMCYMDGLGQAEMYFEVYSANDKCEGEPMLKGSSDGAHGTLPFGSDTCMSGPSAVPFVPLNQVRYGDRPPSPPGTHHSPRLPYAAHHTHHPFTTTHHPPHSTRRTLSVYLASISRRSSSQRTHSAPTRLRWAILTTTRIKASAKLGSNLG